MEQLFQSVGSDLPLIYNTHGFQDMMASLTRRNNRGKIEIMADVLALSTCGIKKTHIMYKANLSYEQMLYYLGELLGKGFVSQDVADGSTIYRTTEKGREFLACYSRMIELVKEQDTSNNNNNNNNNSSSYESGSVPLLTTQLK